MTFAPTWDSLHQHRVPAWFEDAKLGIFIHWGLYSIPGWAPTTGPLPEVVEREGWPAWFRRNPYAEWYMNSLRVPGSHTAQYHAEHHGADFAYEQFAPQFNAALEQWNPDEWAALFAEAGARYVVLTTKHHDGFLLWPSRQPNPFRQAYQTERDLVGDLASAVRAHQMQMGLYYSGGLDWTFNDHVIADLPDLYQAVPQSDAYVAYADAHFRELIERYAPAVLWNDIGYPAAADVPALFADYYAQVPDGVINNRFTQVELKQQSDGAPNPLAHDAPKPKHFDFLTPEYAVFDEIKTEKWESCRGLGYSFGYNRNETPDTILSPTELVRSFVDIVSKNGNLLINVGPTGDGQIPVEQAERLRALGRWLSVNGESIYGTRPWTRAEGTTADGTPVRFTRGADAMYAVLLGTSAQQRIVIADLALPDGAHITLLGNDAALQWEHQGDHIAVTLPGALPDAPAHALRIA